jgi:hypothetical protein
MKTEIERATAVLIGKKLWRCTRAADLAAFQFGIRRPTKTFRGEPAEVGEFALHVQCGWRIAHGDKVLVARRDLYYPANYSSANQAIPEDFDWDISGANLQDRLVTELFQGGTREFAVRRVEVGCAGALQILLEADVSLEVFPDDSHEQEHWRLFAPSTGGPHFVVTGNGIQD